MANIIMFTVSIEHICVEPRLVSRIAVSTTEHTLRSTRRSRNTTAIRIFESGRDSATSVRVHPAMERLSKSLI